MVVFVTASVEITIDLQEIVELCEKVTGASFSVRMFVPVCITH